MRKITSMFVFLIFLFFVSACIPGEGFILKIEFETDGGHLIDPMIFDQFPTNIDLPIPVKEGYVFDGWFLDETFDQSYDFQSLLGKNSITLYAKWVAVVTTTTITFDSNAGSDVLPITLEPGTTISSPQIPTKEGYDFDGWYIDITLETVFVFDTMPQQDITLYAKWVAVVTTTTITFDSNEGSDVTPITLEPGTTISSPQIPTKEGYDFDGWYIDITLETIFVFDTMPQQDITLYAKWHFIEAITYQITYNTNGGNVLDYEALEVGDPIQLPIAHKEGSMFEGWFLDSELTIVFDMTQMPNHDLILYAKWALILNFMEFISLIQSIDNFSMKTEISSINDNDHWVHLDLAEVMMTSKNIHYASTRSAIQTGDELISKTMIYIIEDDEQYVSYYCYRDYFEDPELCYDSEEINQDTYDEYINEITYVSMMYLQVLFPENLLISWFTIEDNIYTLAEENYSSYQDLTDLTDLEIIKFSIEVDILENTLHIEIILYDNEDLSTIELNILIYDLYQTVVTLPEDIEICEKQPVVVQDQLLIFIHEDDIHKDEIEEQVYLFFEEGSDIYEVIQIIYIQSNDYQEILEDALMHITPKTATIIWNGIWFENVSHTLQYSHPQIEFLIIGAQPNNVINWQTNETIDGSPYNFEILNGTSFYYRQTHPGYLAGYTTVMAGYQKIGIILDGTFQREYGYSIGFLQGADAAATELGLANGTIKIAIFEFSQGQDLNAFYVDILDGYHEGIELMVNMNVHTIEIVSQAANEAKAYYMTLHSDDAVDPYLLYSIKIDIKHIINLILENLHTSLYERYRGYGFGFDEGAYLFLTDHSKWAEFPHVEYQHILEQLKNNQIGFIRVYGEHIILAYVQELHKLDSFIFDQALTFLDQMIELITLHESFSYLDFEYYEIKDSSYKMYAYGSMERYYAFMPDAIYQYIHYDIDDPIQVFNYENEFYDIELDGTYLRYYYDNNYSKYMSYSIEQEQYDMNYFIYELASAYWINFLSNLSADWFTYVEGTYILDEAYQSHLPYYYSGDDVFQYTDLYLSFDDHTVWIYLMLDDEFAFVIRELYLFDIGQTEINLSFIDDNIDVPITDDEVIGILTDISTKNHINLEGFLSGLNLYLEDYPMFVAHAMIDLSDISTWDAALQSLIDQEATIIILADYHFQVLAYYIQQLYPDLKIILFDGYPHNVINFETMETILSDKVDFSTGIGKKTITIHFDEREAGFLAGYASVMEGFRTLGVIGGMPTPAVIRYGYGFIEGAHYAATILGLNDGEIKIYYDYLYSFEASELAKNLAMDWYDQGVEVIFTIAGQANESIYAAAEIKNKWAIAPNADQSVFGSMILTSAIEDYEPVIYSILIDIFHYHDISFGHMQTYTIRHYALALTMETSRFENFTIEQYDLIYEALRSGSYSISVGYNDTLEEIDQMFDKIVINPPISEEPITLDQMIETVNHADNFSFGYSVDLHGALDDVSHYDFQIKFDGVNLHFTMTASSYDELNEFNMYGEIYLLFDPVNQSYHFFERDNMLNPWTSTIIDELTYLSYIETIFDEHVFIFDVFMPEGLILDWFVQDENLMVLKDEHLADMTQIIRTHIDIETLYHYNIMYDKTQVLLYVNMNTDEFEYTVHIRIFDIGATAIDQLLIE